MGLFNYNTLFSSQSFFQSMLGESPNIELMLVKWTAKDGIGEKHISFL